MHKINQMEEKQINYNNLNIDNDNFVQILFCMKMSSCFIAFFKSQRKIKRKVIQGT